MGDPVIELLELPPAERAKALTRMHIEHQAMKAALTEIANYREPEDAREDGDAEDAGLDHDEWVEMAYENVIWTAQRALSSLSEAGDAG